MTTSQAPALTEFGRRVRRARTANALSQEAFADLAGFHRTYISAIERGKRNPSLINILRLAEHLNVDPSRLIEGLS
jgi:transcriptional regulator with XRE-family HTH domain